MFNYIYIYILLYIYIYTYIFPDLYPRNPTDPGSSQSLACGLDDQDSRGLIRLYVYRASRAICRLSKHIYIYIYIYIYRVFAGLYVGFLGLYFSRVSNSNQPIR